MSRNVYVFADEFGNFDFRRRPGATKYFAVGTVTLYDDEPAALRHDIHELRTQMAWQGIGLDSSFHCSEDLQAVRDLMFQLLLQHPVRIDVTLLEKSKAQPQVRSTKSRFFKYAWYYHFKYLAQRRLAANDRLLISAAELGTKAERAAFRSGVQDVAGQVAYHLPRQVAFWPYKSEPCLWAADYGLWAVTRKWERGDDRSYLQMISKIDSNYDLWSAGQTHYY